ncbi:MAG TPA: 2-oxo acid dehydrogenase subunit E2, partial [Rugosibacter sp.]|nr:2-oxo acid dehydrogenase subunit E2 [Rugosibacter sp.]
MLIEVKVPQLSESVAEATLSAWHIKEGDAVSRDQNLIDIETDKVVLELPAPAAGVITKVIKVNGDTVVSGEVIAHLDTEAITTAGSSPAVAAAVAPAVPAAVTPAVMPTAMPAARKLMDEKGLTAADVQGTGRGGRILKEDVAGTGKVAAPAGVAKPSGAVSPAPTFAAALPQPTVVNTDAITANRSEQRVPMSRLRVRVAERLLQSQATNAILTTFNEVNMAPVMELRKKYQEKFEKEHGVKLGFMSFFVKAAVAALKKYPIINASVDGNDIVYHGYFDIGIAVGSPRGLVVPILRDADQMSLAQIELKIAEFGQKAKEGKLSLEELQRQLGNTLPGAVGMAARAMMESQAYVEKGIKTASQAEQMLREQIKKGTINVYEFLLRFSNQLKKEYGAGVAYATDQFTANFNRMKNAIFEFYRIVGS